MAFYYAEADGDGLIDSGTMTELSPGPTFPRYPERFNTTVHTSRDGNPVTQAPLKDKSERHWVWEGYKPTVPGYTNVFEELLQLQYKLRLTESPPKSPWVFLKEDVTENFGKLVFGGGLWTFSADYIRVKVTNVSQNVSPQGGVVRYGDMKMTFYVDDATFNLF